MGLLNKCNLGSRLISQPHCVSLLQQNDIVHFCTYAGLSLEPLIGAIASGNAAVLKPSELAPATAEFLSDAIPKYLDYEAIKVIQGGPQVAKQLLDLKWGKIFFTGAGLI